MNPTENQIMNQIIDYLRYRGYLVWRNNTGAAEYEKDGKKRLVRFGQKGASDIFCIDHKNQGRFVAIEVKTPKTARRVTRWQQEFLDNVNAHNGLGFVATSVEEVQDAGL